MTDAPESPDPSIDAGTVPSAPQAAGGSRRRRLWGAAAAVLLIAGGIVGVVVATSSSPPPAGDAMAPSQLLAASLVSARAAGSFRLTVAVSGAGVGERAVLTVGQSGDRIDLTVPRLGEESFIVVGGSLYAESSSAVFYATISGGSLVSGTTQFNRYIGRWVALPQWGQGGGLLTGLSAGAIQPKVLGLAGPLRRAATVGDTVSITGDLQRAQAVPLGPPPGGPATLTISASPPYYPVSGSYQTGGASVTLQFSDWGEPLDIAVPAGVIQLPVTPKQPAEEIAVESNLQTAFTGVKVIYTENNQSYAALNPRSFDAVDTALTGVPGTSASTGPTSISLFEGGSFAIVAASLPLAKLCFAILDNQGTSMVEGARGPGDLFMRLASTPAAACTAASFDTPSRRPDVQASTGGFSLSN